MLPDSCRLTFPNTPWPRRLDGGSFGGQTLARRAGSVSLSSPMRRFPSLALCLFLSSCGWFSEEEEVEEPSGPQLVGRIAAVHEEHGFVLVQGFNDLKLGVGLLLTTEGEEDRAGSLMVTGERSGRYSAADIKAGQIEVGDAVFARPKREEKGPETGNTQKVPPSSPQE